MAVEVILPRVDMDMAAGKLSRWFKEEGAEVKQGEALFEIETDKAAMEVDAPASGVLRGVSAKPGDELPVGTVIGWIAAADEAFDPAAARKSAPADAAPAPAPQAEASASAAAPARTAEPAAPGEGVRATPAARRKAREAGIDVATIRGTGPHGRIQTEDVEAAVAAAAVAEARPASPEKAPVAAALAIPEIAAPDVAKFGPVETQPLSRIQRISGPRMHASWVDIPHVTHCDEADVTDLDAFRRTLDAAAKADQTAPYRVSLLPLLMKATVAALKAHPSFNAVLSPGGDALILRRYWNIGVAVDTADGLVVAVVKDADKKGVLEIARELGALSAKARAGKLTPSDMQGAGFTISSLGGVGGTSFTPIVNAPEVAILGVARAKMTPAWDGEAFQPRLMLPLCLSYDHRANDGATAARFARLLAETLGDMRRALL
jgi:pyruvate dehydrogenase E2 component (dihydrolipoamide acetyltransferase)